MAIIDGFIDNNGCKIHYIETNKDKEKTIIVIPGMINSAEQVFEELNSRLNYHCIFLSLRGRGKSDSPEQGYFFEDQVADIKAIINNLNLKDVYIYGHSVGASFALSYCLSENTNINGLIIGDYPPIYTPLDNDWATELVGNDNNTLSEKAIEGLINDSSFVNMIPKLSEIEFPTLILKGELEDSVLSNQDIEEFKSLSDKISTGIILSSGHDLHQPKTNNFADKIEIFIK